MAGAPGEGEGGRGRGGEGHRMAERQVKKNSRMAISMALRHSSSANSAVPGDSAALLLLSGIRDAPYVFRGDRTEGGRDNAIRLKRREGCRRFRLGERPGQPAKWSIVRTSHRRHVGTEIAVATAQVGAVDAAAAVVLAEFPARASRAGANGALVFTVSAGTSQSMHR